MTAEWVVVLEAVTFAFGSSVSISAIRRMMESMAHMHPTTLYSPQRYALQVLVEAPTPDEALALALADWRRAESSLAIGPWLLTRAEVITAEEFERERRNETASFATGDGEDGAGPHALEEHLLRQAFHDSLTGLADAELFWSHLQHAMRAAERRNVRDALILCDVDDFQGLNGRFGRESGDEFLVTVADRLSSALRPRDSIARIGSDEFAVLIEDTSPPAAAMIGQRLLNLVAAPFLLDGREISITASAGIAVSEPGQSGEELLENCRSALRAAQRQGGGRWEVFHRRETTRAPDAVIVESRPRRANEVACLRLLQRATMAANECETLEDAAKVVLQQVCTHTGWPLGHLYVVAEGAKDSLASSGIWHVSSSPERFAPFRELTEELVLRRGLGLPHVVLSTGRPAYMADVTSDADLGHAMVAFSEGIRAGVAFPVLIGDEVVGVLEFYADSTVDPEDPLWDVMASVGTQLGRVVERHRSAAALRRSEERFRACVRSIPGAVVSVRPDGTVADWLGAAERIFGYSEGEILGTPVALLLPDLFVPGEPPGRLLDQLVNQTAETSAVRKDGARLPVEVSVSTWQASDGQFFTVMICDVTERYKAESELRQREALFRALLKHSSDMVSVLDTDGTLRLHVGPRVLGYAEGEKVGTRVWDLLHPDDLERAAIAFGELLSRPGTGPRPIELRVRHKDGSWRWIEVVATNLTDNSDVGGVVLNSRDVTERKILEQALDNTHAELEAAQALAGLGSWRVVGESDRAWSAGMYEIFGWDPSQPVPDAEAIAALMHPDDREGVRRELQRVRAGEARSLEFRIVAPGGGLRWISTWAFPLRDVDGTIVGIHGVAEDVTHRKAIASAAEAKAYGLT